MRGLAKQRDLKDHLNLFAIGKKFAIVEATKSRPAIVHPPSARVALARPVVVFHYHSPHKPTVFPAVPQGNSVHRLNGIDDALQDPGTYRKMHFQTLTPQQCLG